MKTTLPPTTGVREPSKWRRRQPIEASKLNELREAVRSMLPFVQPARQVGVRVESTEKGGIAQFQFVADADDYIVCRRLKGTTLSSQQYSIAKPYLLRVTPFNGSSRGGISYTYTTTSRRVATSGATSENQVVVPAYRAGDVIYAALGISGGVGVTLGNSVDVLWLDLNVDGRAWAKEAE